MASEHAPTAPEYIGHHLRHWQNHAEPQAIVDWSYINYDSVFWSFVMGALAVFLLWRASRKATSGVPGKFQGFVELLVEMVVTQAKSIWKAAEVTLIEGAGHMLIDEAPEAVASAIAAAVEAS